MIKPLRLSVLLLLMLAVVLLVVRVSAEFNHDESADGDLSNDRFAPSQLVLENGINQVTAVSSSGDREYFTVALPDGTQLTNLNLSRYQSVDDTAFIAMQSGITFTEPPTLTSTSNLMGYIHFGEADLDTDILDDLSTSGDTITFTVPLTGSHYTFWAQQAGSVTTYTLDFVVSPVTSTVAYSEIVSGDLSGDGLAPNTIELQLGGNLISASSIRDDVEYFTINVPCGQQLDAILLDHYDSIDQAAFIGVMLGAQFTESILSPDPANMLGWHHFGTKKDSIGSDILIDIGEGQGAIGFTGPLGSNVYSFWSQQTSPLQTDYTLNFVVSENPNDLCLTLTEKLYLPLTQQSD